MVSRTKGMAMGVALLIAQPMLTAPAVPLHAMAPL